MQKVRSVLIFIALIFTPIITFAQSYYTAGDVNARVYWDVSQGIVSEEDDVLASSQQPQMSLAVDITGPDGNNAIGQGGASLAQGWVGLYGYALTPSTTAGIAGSTAESQLRDTLYITVPAGTYAEDVVISINGHVDGSLASTGSASAEAECRVRFGDSTNTISWSWTDEDGQTFEEDFVLSSTLFSAGTLSQARTYTRVVQASPGIPSDSPICQ